MCINWNELQYLACATASRNRGCNVATRSAVAPRKPVRNNWNGRNHEVSDPWYGGAERCHWMLTMSHPLWSDSGFYGVDSGHLSGGYGMDITDVFCSTMAALKNLALLEKELFAFFQLILTSDFATNLKTSSDNQETSSKEVEGFFQRVLYLQFWKMAQLYLRIF